MLNKLVFLLCVLTTFIAPAQEQSGSGVKGKEFFDYKDPEQFKSYNKRRKVVAIWQINQLKHGAIVVRLKNSNLLVNQLLKSGQTALAKQKVLEQYALNKNTMMAYRDNLTFCKVYFIYSNSSDSLLNGARSGLFLDTNLTIDPSITMNENFYLIAERDYGYNSSIGFVREDSARLVTERGNAVKQMVVVLKNKYGHQLKAPFPYLIKEKNFMDAGLDFPITVYESPKGTKVSYTVNKTYLADKAADPSNKSKHALHESETLKIVQVKKEFLYEKLSGSIDQLNSDLKQFYQQSPELEMKRLSPDFLPYLY